MAELTADQVQALIRAGVPMAEDIDLRIERLDSDLAVARVPFHGKLVRPGGTLSGPTIMALADAAMYDGKKDGKRTVRGSSFAPLLEH